MKKTFRFLASLTLGFMVASCQNGLEEVINESEVQDELATTRAEEGPNETGVTEEPLVTSNINLNISGSSIISGPDTETYRVTGSNLNNYNFIWSYDSNILQVTDSTATTITFSLVNSSSTVDTSISVQARRKSDNLEVDAAYLNIGCNGPLANTSSLRVVRSSDGVEVYPALVGLSPNSFYYAYLTNTQASNMTLLWEFSNGFDNNNNAELYDHYGYTAYFKTSCYGWTFLTVYGKMPGSSVYKYLLGVTLYDEIDSNNFIEEENEEQSKEE